MMKGFLNLYITLSAIILASCMSSVDVTKALGEKAIIKFQDQKVSINAELIAIDDSSFIYSSENNFIYASFDSLKSIYVENYNVSSRNTVFFISLILDVSVIAQSFSPKGNIWIGITAALHAVGCILGFQADLPKVQFIPPFQAEDIRKLRLFSRYPNTELMNLLSK